MKKSRLTELAEKAGLTRISSVTWLICGDKDLGYFLHNRGLGIYEITHRGYTMSGKKQTQRICADDSPRRIVDKAFEFKQKIHFFDVRFDKKKRLLDIRMKFKPNGVVHTKVLEIPEEDYWSTINLGDVLFDVHYCEDYDSVSIYDIDMNAQNTETDYWHCVKYLSN